MAWPEVRGRAIFLIGLTCLCFNFEFRAPYTDDVIVSNKEVSNNRN